MIRYDFHLHSALSPCGDMDMTPNNIVNMAMLNGLDAIAISDHNTIGNSAAAMEVGRQVGVTVVPAMEVATAEEVHILTLYPTLEAAEFVAKQVYEALPDIPNQPDIFGQQTLMNAADEITGYEEKLLLNACQLSMEELFRLVTEVDGVFIPAHVDRHSYSVLTNLGFIPDDLDIRWIEVSRRVTDLSAYLDSRPDLAQYRILQSSDAHYLEDIAQEGSVLADGLESLFPHHKESIL